MVTLWIRTIIKPLIEHLICLTLFSALRVCGLNSYSNSSLHSDFKLFFHSIFLHFGGTKNMYLESFLLFCNFFLFILFQIFFTINIFLTFSNKPVYTSLIFFINTFTSDINSNLVGKFSLHFFISTLAHSVLACSDIVLTESQHPFTTCKQDSLSCVN